MIIGVYSHCTSRCARTRAAGQGRVRREARTGVGELLDRAGIVADPD